MCEKLIILFLFFLSFLGDKVPAHSQIIFQVVTWQVVSRSISIESC